MLRRIAIGIGCAIALALGPTVLSAPAIVHPYNIWMSARTYPRVLHTSGSHRFTLEVALQNRRSTTSGLTVSVDNYLHLVFAANRMVYAVSYGRLSTQPPAVAHVMRQPAPTNSPRWMCFTNTANSFIAISVTMPAHTSTTLRLPVTAVVPYWLPNPVTPLTDHGLYTLETLNVGWSSAFASSSWSVTAPAVRLDGAPGEEISFSGPGEIIDDGVGRALPIDGTTDPPAPHRLLVLSARHWLGHSRWRLVPIAAIRTDAHGYFTYRWVPQRPGYYQIQGRMPHPPPGILPDSACGEIAHVIAP